MINVKPIKEIPVSFTEGPYIPKILEVILSLEKDKEMNLYFRGEPQKYDYVIPSLYREENESVVYSGSETYYRDLLSELGKVDYSDSSSLARTMSEFRHFGAITRIIDVSKNPLASLYFAVEDHDDDDGYIYIFASDSRSKGQYETRKKEKYDTGHTIAIKMALNLMPQSAINDFLVGCNVLMPIVVPMSKTYDKYKLIDENDLNLMEYSTLSLMDLDTVIKKFNDKYGENIKIKLNDLTEVERRCALDSVKRFMNLLNQRAKVREELKFPFHIYFDLGRAHLFVASMNTTRISRQRGAFIFPAFVNTKTDDKNVMPFDNIQNEIQSSIFEFLYPHEIGNTIRIPHDIKKAIKSELYQLGIDGGFLYADIKHQSDALLLKNK